jgi:hypothetical protein
LSADCHCFRCTCHCFRCDGRFFVSSGYFFKFSSYFSGAVAYFFRAVAYFSSVKSLRPVFKYGSQPASMQGFRLGLLSLVHVFYYYIFNIVSFNFFHYGQKT